jgi:mannitol/fructose-specific phosphotransferase system IIA component (Ntr-type)
MSSSDSKNVTLADFTSETLIVPHLKARDMEEAIRELSDAFERSDSRWDAGRLSKSAIEREAQMSTALEWGAAFPHVRSPACLRLQFAMGRAAGAFEWGSSGAEVRFVFLNAVPPDEAMGYLKLLSGMGRLGKETGLWEEIEEAKSAGEMLELLGRIPVKR